MIMSLIRLLRVCSALPLAKLCGWCETLQVDPRPLAIGRPGGRPLTRCSRAAVIALAAMAAVALLAGPANAQTARSVLARYAVWRGGAAFASMAAISETGEFADGGLRGAGSRYATRDGRVLAQSRFGPFATTLQVTPTEKDYTDLAGQRLPLSRLEVGYARADAALLLPLAAAPAFKVSLQAREMIGGRPWEVVEVDRGDAGRYDYLIAPDTGALFGVRISRNGALSTQTYADWRMVRGVRLPFHVHEEGQAGLGALQSDTTDFIVGHASLDPRPATPEPLANRRVVSFAKGASSSGWIAFHLDSGAIFLDLTIDGQPARALLDSGASQTAIDKTFAETHGITSAGRFLVGGQGETTSTAYTPGVTIQAGDARLDGVVANIIDLQQPGTRLSPPLLAILGAEVFAETTVEIDYPKHRLRFLAPAAAPHLAEGVTLPLGLFEGSFHFPISVERAPPIACLLDTGSDGALQLFPAYWQPRGMLRARPFKESGNGGVGGIASYRTAAVASINIGSIEVRNVPTAFQMPGNPVSNETGILGNCGDAIYARFHLVIDFPERTITLESNAASAEAKAR